LSTKGELEKIVRLLKEETAKLQEVNKQRFDRITELEEKLKIQGLQLALLFETLRYDSRHKGFAQLVMMLGRMPRFWKSPKPLNAIEEQIKEMEQRGLFNFDNEDDDDDSNTGDRFRFPF